ncbi:MAG: methyltransferase domain-containing protein [Acidobacteria bacterium]|nr:methyltransferase domain-containing protein [Acidobacteriota bacterium]
MTTDATNRNLQKKFDFRAPRPRPFLANLPAKIDIYEDGIADFFRWRTGLDYYLTIDRIVDFVVDTGRMKILDLLADTAVFALNLAGRKAFCGHIHSFDSNVTLLERAKQRAVHLKLQETVEFRLFQEEKLPVPDAFADVAVSIFDFHRHPAKQYLSEILRVLVPNGYLIIAELIETELSKTSWTSKWKKLCVKYIKKNKAEAEAVYYDREEIIGLLFDAGFRQVILQGLNEPDSPRLGVFSLIAATK